jgi:hypothetical protein
VRTDWDATPGRHVMTVRATDAGGLFAETTFTVTEVFQKQGGDWKILALTFSSVRDTHEIQK